ncbi:COG4705 family protein [Actinomycetospora sp. CA-053990]|uniref:COG4705 family protein n=1 Tax=Actinomycetospora sp. CA-053990 TaxID=3239891 RepID=UPI003D89E81C
MTTHQALATRRVMLNKVPEVTVYFWIIKVLCTTVGETAADFLNIDLGFGLTGTSIATGVLLALIMVLQFRAPRYVPGLYWTAVALVSVFGTLVTDNLTDNIGVPLQASTIGFAVILAGIFLAWYGSERTLSIHSITTTRRETFYWLAVLFTFALGTAAGDLMAEALSLGYLVSLAIVAGVIAVIAIAWRMGLHPVLAFWIIYVLTRPLGASLGDLLAQTPDHGGLGLGSTVTSVIFLVAIVGTVIYLAVSRADVTELVTDEDPVTGPVQVRPQRASGLVQTVVVVGVLVAAAGAGYVARTAALQDASAPAASGAVAQGSAAPAAGAPATGPNASLGDLSEFRTITQDTLDRLNAGDQSGATTRVTDLETAWDQAQGRLEARDDAAWTRVDTKIDDVLTQLRAGTPDPAAERQALTALLAELG